MTINAGQFRANYPAFTNATTFPVDAVDYYLGLGYALMNAARWGAQLDLAVQLYTAHNLVLEARMNAEANNGGIPGANGSGLGVVNSKAVGKVSIGYDVSAVTKAQEQFAGDYGLTLYGLRLWKLIRLFGAGPLQIATPGSSPFGGTTNSAWSGPDVTPGFTNFS